MGIKNIVIIIIVIALVGIGAWVLLGGEKEIEDGVVPLGEEEEEEVESLTEILGKAVGISSLKYDMIVTPAGETAITTTMWWEGKKIRMEGTFEGKSMVYLVDMDEQLAYMYFPAENTAMKISLGKAQETTGESPTEQSESIMTYNPVTVGTEILDGKNCLVIEYTTETEETKSWVWIEHGLLIRIESTTDKGTSVAELKNIEFSDIADSMFELPAGVQVMEIPIF